MGGWKGTAEVEGDDVDEDGRTRELGPDGEREGKISRVGAWRTRVGRRSRARARDPYYQRVLRRTTTPHRIMQVEA